MKIKKELKIEIIAVGSELLTPFFQDTNSLYLTKYLNEVGMKPSFKTIVSDDWDDLITAVKEALSRSDIIFSTGGLGPTKDDRTRDAFAAALNRKLTFKKEILKKIEQRFRKRDIEMPSINERQAYVIEGSEILDNNNGTAPGSWIDTGTKICVLLPGPPQELKPMFKDFVFPRLQKMRKGFSARRVLKIAGLSESEVESLIQDIYPDVRYLKVTTLAYPGQIELHLNGYTEESQNRVEETVLQVEKKISERLKDNIFSSSGEKLEEVVGNLLRRENKTLSIAESCTGGLLCDRITGIPGSSDYFTLGVICYSNEAKAQLLGVPSELIKKYGAVSAQAAKAMAYGVKKIAKTNYGLAITGIAGPGGGADKKPVGAVFTALVWGNRSEAIRNQFLGNRSTIKFQSTQKALDMLRHHLLNEKLQKEK